MSGGPTAYRLIGSGVTALCFVIIFWRVFSRNALAVDSSPVPQLANLLRPGSLFVFGGRNSGGQSSLHGQRWVVSMD